MEGSAAASAAAESKTAGKLVSAGSPVPGEFKPSATSDAGGQETQEAKAAREAKELEEKNKLPDLTDDQLKELLKGKGIELDDTGLTGLAEKLKPAPAQKAPEDVEAEKKAAEAAFEKRMLDHFIANGGTAENFVALKQIASTDLAALSEYEIKKEMKDAGFSDEEVITILKERYYQINPEELVIGEDEKPEDFEKRKAVTEKKIAYGAKLLASKGSNIQKQAVDGLNALREAIKTEDLLKEKETAFSSKVDEIVSKFPRKLTFELGKVLDQDIAPISFDVTEEDIAEVTGVLKDTAKRNQYFFNKDNDLNLDNVVSLMVRNKILESALKAGFLEGGNRQVAAFEKVFPGKTAKEIGVGGAGNGQGQKGKLVAAGKPEVGVRQNN